MIEVVFVESTTPSKSYRVFKSSHKGETMNNELVKKIVLPFIVFIAILGVWTGIANVVEDFPTPANTYVSAFGGVDADGDEVEGVLADPFYIENEDDKGLFWQILESLKRVFGGFSLALDCWYSSRFAHRYE